MADIDKGAFLDPASPAERPRLVSAARYAQVGRLADGVTHDINNLLGAGVAYAELVLLDKQLTAESKRMLNEVVNSLMRSSEMLGGLTVLTRPESRSANAVELQELVRQTLGLSAYLFKRAKVEVASGLTAENVTVVGDSPSLQVALLHLLANAREALLELPPADRKLRIRVSSDQNSAAISVWNSGPPIADALRESVFNPYFTTKPAPHLGMGLFAARDTAELHDGRLDYSPEEGFVLRVARYPAYAHAMRHREA